MSAIANTPGFIKGIINLRGGDTPIVDLRIKFKLGRVEYNQLAVVIILNLGKRVVGIVVDGVSDLIALASEQVRPAPELSSTLETRDITGLGTVDDRMLILIDIEKLMRSNEMALMDQVA